MEWSMELVQKMDIINNIDKKNVFYNILEPKNVFLGYKNKKFKSRKIDIFPKGLTNSFGPKMAISLPFFNAVQALKMSFKIFQNEKTLFQAKKPRSSKSLKNDIFPKGVNPQLWSKNGHLYNQARQARKMSFTRFQNVKTLFQAKKNKVQKV